MQSASEITDSGAIRRILAPAGWRESGAAETMPDGRFVRTFSPPEAADVHFCLYYRPGPISLESAGAFLTILIEPFHDLPPEEIALLTDVLESMALPESFVIHECGTGYLNGKRIIRVAGTWTRLWRNTVVVVTNADERGCRIQQIYYSAPSGQFLTYLNAATDAMQTVEWNQ